MSAPYPWLEGPWRSLTGALRRGNLGHAYLLSGADGLGKFAFAEAFAQAALCESPHDAGEPCGACRSCKLFRLGHHPDYRLLAPEEDRKTIVIDQVRDLIAFEAIKSQYGGPKIAVVCPAEVMTTGAANALLKVLEEPPAGALMLLVSHRPGRLAATVVSRCQRVPFALPDWTETLAWLARNGQDNGAGHILAGAPLAIAAGIEAGTAGLLDEILAALADVAGGARHPLDAARAFAGTDATAFIDGLERLLQALTLFPAGHRPAGLHLPPESERHLQEISNKLNSKRFFLYLDEVNRARAMVYRSSGVRGAEIIEQLWFAWAQATLTETTV